MLVSLLLSALAILASGPSRSTPSRQAQEAPGTGWLTPPPEVVAIVDAPPPPSVSESPDAQWLLLIESPALPPLEDVARAWVGLAGLRLDPRTNDRQRVSFSTGLALRAWASEPLVEVELPEGARIGDVSWSHSSRRFAFTLVREDGVDLFVAPADLSAETIRPTLVARGLNGVFGRPYEWLPDGERLLILLVPEDRGPAPEPPRVPSGPTVQETSGNRSPLRTLQDLLASPYDEELFEHLGRTQLAVADPRSGALTPLGPAGLISSFEPSPDGRFALVECLRRPFSYLMSWRSFPASIELWDLSSGSTRVLYGKPLEENVPIEGVPTGPRSHAWQQSEGATVVWVEALDGGDPKREAEWRDQWYAFSAPFEGQPVALVRTQHRARGLSWMREPQRLITGEYDRDRRWTRSLLHDLSAPDSAPIVLDDRSVNDRYGDPGSLLFETDERGARLVRQDGPWAYRSGSGDTPGGARPFLDRQNLETLAVERLWRCAPGSLETLQAIQASAAEQKPRVLTVYETPDEPPNWRLRDLEQDTIQTLTDFPDPTPQLRGIRKELVNYERADGVALSATLYLPKDYQPGTRLPLIVWAYPMEYNDPATAGQVRGSPYRFTRIGGISHLLFLTQGYAIMDGATIPIVGDPETMNDRFLEQLVASAQAAIDKAVELGVADGGRAGVGGHSYGAFMTANLLAHCDLFRAGIARSGAYNRTLTPFGFQAERRTLWEAPGIYTQISPFFQADRIDEPLLMIHGEMDSNSGTFPMQSERLFQAIKGHGGTARLVLLPYEDHGYRSREATLHCLAEMFNWFDRYVKDPAAPVEAGYPKSSD